MHQSQTLSFQFVDHCGTKSNKQNGCIQQFYLAIKNMIKKSFFKTKLPLELFKLIYSDTQVIIDTVSTFLHSVHNNIITHTQFYQLNYKSQHLLLYK